MKIEELVRREICELSPYKVEGILDQTLSQKVVKLDLNENFAVAIDVTGKLLLEVCRNADVRSYPPPYGNIAVKALSGFLGFTESEVCVGNGGDEVLDSLMKVFVKTGSKVLVVEPTFSMYTYFTQLYGGRKVTALLRPNFELDVDGVIKRVDRETPLLIICSPNNPTSNQFKERAIKQILQEFNGVVVVDETYADFAGYTVVDWVRNFDNLIVLRSFSKAFGLAGIRFGFLVSNKSIIEYIRRAISPFNVNIVTQQLVALALQNWKYFKERIQYVIEERKWLTGNLARIDGITPYPSDANFILFKVTRDNTSSSTITKMLESRNVLVKDRGNLPLLANCIRVTVGTRDMNQTFLSALEGALEET